MHTLHPDSLKFLTAIATHNSRSYFDLIKPLYIQIWQALGDWTQDIIDHCILIDRQLQDLEANQCIFRIYRDARRIKEWDLLYKPNRWIVLASEGKKSQSPSFYIHLEPSKSFVCAGLYWPDSVELSNLRHFLADHADQYYKLTRQTSFVDYRWDIHGEISTRLPRSRDPQTLYPELVCRKQFLITRHYDDAQVLDSSWFDIICEDYRQSLDRINLLRQGVDYTSRDCSISSIQ